MGYMSWTCRSPRARGDVAFVDHQRSLLTLALLAASSLVGREAIARPPSAADADTLEAEKEAPAPAAPLAGTEPDASSPTAATASQPTASPPTESEAPAPPAPFQPRPPPLHVEYLQYGVAIAANMRLASGATCPDDADTPCILGGGGGLAVRGGWRPPGTWYVGGAYEFTSMDSGNLYRLGILQQLRGEVRYLPETGTRVAPYLSAGLGGFGYGNEWGVETGGAVASLGGGVEAEVTRFAVVGVALAYSPMLIAGWTDTANQDRATSLAQFLRLELVFELRSELSREGPDGRTRTAQGRFP